MLFYSLTSLVSINSSNVTKICSLRITVICYYMFLKSQTETETETETEKRIPLRLIKKYSLSCLFIYYSPSRRNNTILPIPFCIVVLDKCARFSHTL